MYHVPFATVMTTGRDTPRLTIRFMLTSFTDCATLCIATSAYSAALTVTGLTHLKQVIKGTTIDGSCEIPIQLDDHGIMYHETHISLVCVLIRARRAALASITRSVDDLSASAGVLEAKTLTRVAPISHSTTSACIRAIAPQTR